MHSWCHEVNPSTHAPRGRRLVDMGTNASGNQSGGSAETYDVVNSGQSDDIENSLTGQGTSDRETLMDIVEAEGDSPIPPADEPE